MFVRMSQPPHAAKKWDLNFGAAAAAAAAASHRPKTRAQGYSLPDSFAHILLSKEECWGLEGGAGAGSGAVDIPQVT